MAADPNHSAFFPATWLCLLRPFSAAVRAGFAASAIGLPLLVFAGLRRLRVSSFSAAAIAAAAAVSGPALSLMPLPSSLWAAALFLPYLALCGGPARGSLILAGIVLGLVILAGEPVMAIECGILGAVFAVSGGAFRESRIFALRVAAPLVLGALVAAPQVLGAAGLIGETVRGAGLPTSSGPAYFSVRPLRAFSVLWPGLFGDVLSPDPAGYWGKAFFDSGAPYIYSLAIGTAALLLLAAAFRERLGRRLLLVAGVAAVASLGRYLPGGEWLLSLPGASSLRYPEKWLFFAALAALAAAAVGLDGLRSGDRGARRAVIAGAAVVAGVSLAAAALVTAAPGASLRVLRATRIVSPDLAAFSHPILGAISSDFLQVGAFAFLAGAAARLVRPPGRAAAAIAALVLFELFLRGFDSLPFAPASFYDSPPAAAAAARKAGGRLYYDRETEVVLDPLRPMRPAVWGLSFAGNNDIDRFSPRRSFFFALDLSRASFSDPRKAALLRLAGVGSVSTSDPAAASTPGLAEVARTAPGRSLSTLLPTRRVRVVFGARAVSGEREARGAIWDASFDPESEAVLEGPAPALAEEGIGRAETVARTADSETIDATASSSALLVRSETFDPGWRAEIDGRPARVAPADFAFQAVELPPGRHRVVFRYRDPLITWGMFVSLWTMFGCAIALRGMRTGRTAATIARGGGDPE